MSDLGRERTPPDIGRAQPKPLRLQHAHVLHLRGAGFGKLTIGREVARRSGYALFHNHLVMDALLAVFPFGSPEFVTLREKFWIDTIRAAALSGRSLVFTYCPEPTVDAALPERLEALVQQAGGAVSFIRLEVSEEEQERRLVAPSREGRKLRRVEGFAIMAPGVHSGAAGDA